MKNMTSLPLYGNFNEIRLKTCFSDNSESRFNMKVFKGS